MQDTASSVYLDIGHYDTCKGIWQQLLTSYNQQRKSANLVFFVDALDHLTRLHRVLSLPQVQKAGQRWIDQTAAILTSKLHASSS